jgi:hypothetical protein
MRSDLIFGAMAHVSNRYLLSKLAAMAVREMHKPGIRVEETIDHVFMHFSLANPMAKEQKEPPAAVPYLCIEPPYSSWRGLPPRSTTSI